MTHASMLDKRIGPRCLLLRYVMGVVRLKVFLLRHELSACLT